MLRNNRLIRVLILLSMFVSGITVSMLVTQTTTAHAAGTEPTWALPYPVGTQAYLGDSGLHGGNYNSIRDDSTGTIYRFNNAGMNTASIDLGFAGQTSPSSIPATAMAPGKVLAVWASCHVVLIDHYNGWWAEYVHLGNIQVSANTVVQTGSVVGYPIGTNQVNPSCGEQATFTHVHFALANGSGTTGTFISMIGTALSGHTVLNTTSPAVLSGFGRYVTVPSAGPTFVSNHKPVVGKDADGRMEVFEVAQDNQLWHNYEMPGSNQWSGWLSMGGSWPNDPAVSLNSNGTLEIFIVGNQGPNGSGGGLFHAWQTSPGGTSWTGWNMMSGAWPAGVPAVASNLSGAREVFMRGLNANLYHAWQCGGCSGGWSAWYPMGGYWNTNPVVADNSNGTMTVFMVGESTQLYVDQESSSGNWSGWISLGGSWPGQPSVGTNLGGGLEVFLRGNDGNIYHGWQNSVGSTSYNLWHALGASGISHDPVVGNNADGRLEVFVVAGNTSLYDTWEDSHGNWSNWTNLSGSWPGQPAVILNMVNGLEIFMTGNYPAMYHEWQVSSGSSGSYTGWVQLL